MKCVAPCKKIQIVESCLLNWAQGIRNTPDDWYPESKFHWQGRQNPESLIQSQESRVHRVNPESKIVLD